MTKCKHSFAGFKNIDIASKDWQHSECALCMLLLLEDMYGHYKEGIQRPYP